jgi:hypothetical protein
MYSFVEWLRPLVELRNYFVPGSARVLNPDLYLRSPRPPLFKDFFDPHLHVKLANSPTKSMFRLAARFEAEAGILIH